MHANYEVSIFCGSKVVDKVKVDNRQTNRQTDRQDKNNMPPIIRFGGIKIRANNEGGKREENLVCATLRRED